jgi:hypothetical protein
MNASWWSELNVEAVWKKKMPTRKMLPARAVSTTGINGLPWTDESRIGYTAVSTYRHSTMDLSKKK